MVLRDEQSLNSSSIDSTIVVPSPVKSIDSSSVMPENIPSIVLSWGAVKLLKSSARSFLLSANIVVASVNFSGCVSGSLIVRASVSLNMLFIVEAFEISKFETSMVFALQL